MKKPLCFKVISLTQLLFCLALNSESVFADDLTISGSNTLGAKLIPECAKAYLASKSLSEPVIVTTAPNEFVVKAPDLEDRIVIKAHGSSTGFRSVLKGEAQIAMSSRPIKDKEVALLSYAGDMRSIDAEHTIAVDGLAVLVHPSNVIDSLTTIQIARIFSGDIVNWSELGGENLPITIYARDENSGTWDTFKGLVLGKRYTLRDDAERFESNDDLSDKVASDRGGIGFAGLASLRNAKALAVADEDTSPVVPAHISVATEDYPLTRRLYLYTPPSLKNELVKNFVDFCHSQEGQDIVADVGFISQNIVAVSQQVVTNAPDRYQVLAEQGERLSVNFRFVTGSSKLDNKAMKDIRRLIDYLKLSDNEDRPIFLIGFSDESKSSSSEKLLSRFRALAVWSQLFNKDVLVNEAIGFGAFMPVASNNNDVARLKNSRVEVWIAKKEKTIE